MVNLNFLFNTSFGFIKVYVYDGNKKEKSCSKQKPFEFFVFNSYRIIYILSYKQHKYERFLEKNPKSDLEHHYLDASKENDYKLVKDLYGGYSVELQELLNYLFDNWFGNSQNADIKMKHDVS
ncbi:hypothetical protein [Gelidibacter pelagius]|uniref:Uncharacterized protein n=1 Tax=Gelidibacter pelagius TaxID=2819985 RepID=A0ABS3SW74_9FLAO|nr:hypothetical protein [Gelidibacter pelagius]MBO3099158.1 hypothetical protein [Gelidibacter pelagius]